MSIKAILAGLVFNLIISVLTSVVLQLALIFLRHVPPALPDIHNPSEVQLTLNLVVGLVGDFGGGYVAGRIGRQDPILNALLTGAVDLVLGAAVLFLLAGFLPLPWWYTAAGLLLTVPAAYAGGAYAAPATARRG